MSEESEEKNCAHGVCNCPADAESDYCSPYCEAAKPTEQVQVCDCGHPTCVG